MQNRNYIIPGRVVQDFFDNNLGYACYESSDGYYPTLKIYTLFQPNEDKGYMVHLNCTATNIDDPYGFRLYLYKDHSQNKYYYLDTEMPDLCPSKPFDSMKEVAEEVDLILLEWLDDNMVHWDMIYEEPETLSYWTNKTGMAPINYIPPYVLQPIKPKYIEPPKNPPTTSFTPIPCRKTLNMDLLSKIKK